MTESKNHAEGIPKLSLQPIETHLEHADVAAKPVTSRHYSKYSNMITPDLVQLKKDLQGPNNAFFKETIALQILTELVEFDHCSPIARTSALCIFANVPMYGIGPNGVITKVERIILALKYTSR